LVQLADLGSRQEKLRRIWEPTYTLVDHIVLWNVGRMHREGWFTVTDMLLVTKCGNPLNWRAARYSLAHFRACSVVEAVWVSENIAWVACLMSCFRIVYREVKEEEGSGHEVGGESTPVITLYSRGSRDAGTLSSTTSPSTPIPGTPSMSCTVEDVLQLLRHLFVISTFREDAQNTADGERHTHSKWDRMWHVYSEWDGKWHIYRIFSNLIRTSFLPPCNVRTARTPALPYGQTPALARESNPHSMRIRICIFSPLQL
jgi:hypothetical protein